LRLRDPTTPEGLEQILALIYFYTGEDMNLDDVLETPGKLEQVIRKWSRIEFSLQFEDKMEKQKVKYG